MKLREYATVLTGILTFFAAAAAQWAWTQRPIEDVIFIAILAAMIGVGVFLVATESGREQPRRKHRAQQWEPTEDSFMIVTLNREEWKRNAVSEIGKSAETLQPGRPDHQYSAK